MANEKLVSKLQREGVEAWNQWREEGSTLVHDLSFANLCDADLSYASLANVNLRDAKLARADLHRADLRVAELVHANLCDANLRDAKLNKAYLIYADLSGANLRDANLSGANLRDANLSGANLSGVDLSGADQSGVDLSGANLRDANLNRASVVDAHWDGVILAAVDWESVKKLGDEYKAHSSKKTSDYQDAVRANRQLAVALREHGLNEEADRFAYRAQLLQRVVWRKRRRPLKYLFSLFLDLLAGYGYRPGRALLWYFVIIGVFATAYAIFGQLPPFPDALAFSFTSFHGRGFFPSVSGDVSLYNRIVVLAAIEAVIGLFIEISFIATFTQRFFGR
jgi:hypothetical protein